MKTAHSLILVILAFIACTFSAAAQNNSGTGYSNVGNFTTLFAPIDVQYPPGTSLGATVDLGNIATGASGMTQTFTITNTTGASITELTLSLDGANAGDFAVSALSGTTVPNGGTVTFTVTFTPGGPDFRSAMLRVSGTGNVTTKDLRLSGTGLGTTLVNAVMQAYAKPGAVGTTQAGDNFGYSVAISGDTVVVGAIAEDSSTTGVNSSANESATDSGAAYVFVRTGTTWTQQAYLKANNTGAGDNFGYSVAVSGDTVVVGAPHESSSTTGVDTVANESALNAGAAYVFVRNGTTWTQQAYVKAQQVNSADRFGFSVAVSGDTLVVGAPFEDSSTTGVNSTADELATAAGAAYVFARNGTMWAQQAYLKAHQVSVNDEFGFSVAVSGDTVVVGADNEASNTTGVNSIPNELAGQAGAAYVLVRSGTTWTQQSYLKAQQVNISDRFGWSVAVSGDTLVVGSIAEDSSTTGVNSSADELANEAGAAYIFVRSGVTWTQQAYLKAQQVNANDTFGRLVAVSGDMVVVGAASEDSSTTGVSSTANESAQDAGAAYVFVRSGVTWTQQRYLKAHQVNSVDLFGSVAVSGDTVVVGAYFEGSNTTGLNSTANELVATAGAAYIFANGIAPTVTTPTSANFTVSTATMGGNVTSNGGAAFIERGVVYARTSLNNNPEIGGSNVTTVIAGGTTAGVFTADGSGLAVHTNYTFKAYATNSVGTSYSSAATFTTANTSPIAPAATTTGTTGDEQTYTVAFPATDTDGDAVTITGVAAVTGLTVNSFTATNVTFTPDASFTGDASFTYTLSDEFGGTASGIITVTVSDNDAPIVATYSDVGPIEATSSGGAVVTYADGSANDNIGVTSITYSKNSGTSFPLGATTVTITAKDAANNAGTKTFSVSVVDTTGPVIAPHADVSVLAPSLAGIAVNYTPAIVTDAVTGAPTITYSQNSGTVFPIGTTIVTVNATDAANNAATPITFKVSVHLTAPINTITRASGDPAPGAGVNGLPADAKLASFNIPATSDEGDVAFIAKWTSATGGPGGKPTKGTGFFHNGNCLAVVGGSAGIIEPGAKWKSFSDPVVSNGTAISIATLSGVKTGISVIVGSLSGSSGLTTFIRAGDTEPGLSDSTFKSFKSVSVQSGNRIAFLAQLTNGSGTPKVTAANDIGLWYYESGSLYLVVREGDLVGGKTIKTLMAFKPGNGSPGSGRGTLVNSSVNSDPHVTALALFTDKTQGIIAQNIDDGPPSLVLSLSGNAATGPATGGSFASYGLPARNSAENATFLAKLNIGTGVTKADATGIFLGPDGSGKFETIARIGSDAGITGAKFKLLKDPVLSDDGTVAFLATTTAKGPSAQTLWWKLNNQPLALLAQADTPASDFPSAKWKSFSNIAIAGGGRGPIFVATLVPNKFSVSAKTATGVWACDFNGTPRVLFRTGDMINGKKLTKFTLLKASVGNEGVTRSFNNTAKVVWVATFSDKTTAIITTQIP